MTARRSVWCALLVAVAVGCASETDEPRADSPSGGAGAGGSGVDDVSPPDTTVAYLTPAEHLQRASMALRGLRPGLDELEAVIADPSILPAIVDFYLDSEEFGVTVREMHEEALLIGVDPAFYPAGFPAIGALAGMSATELNRSIVEAPVRLVEHVVVNDRPYTEIVTAPYTLADRVVSTVWGTEYDDDGDEWQEVQYLDDRPTAGLLSDSFLFTRHSTTLSNKGRGRANVIARSLLCYDFLSREIPVDSGVDLADEDAVTDAVRNNPACVSCHQTLDPLASYFSSYSPIFVPGDIDAYPYDFYRPVYDSLLSVTDPAYFGITRGNAIDLGLLVSQDPRFSLCAAKRFYAYLAEVPIDDVPIELATELQNVLVDHDMNAKALARAIVLSDAFRVSHALTEEAADSTVGLLKVRPRQLERMIEDLTGFRWKTNLPIDIGTGQVGEVDLLSDAFFGFKVLAGGMDSYSVTRPSHTTSATVTLVLDALAARVAPHVVTLDFANEANRRWLLRGIEPTDTREAAVRAQLADLQLRLFAHPASADDPAVDDAWTLYQSVLDAGGDARRAWQVTLYAMLQDVRLVYY